MPTEFFQLAEKTPSITTQIQNERTTTKRKSGTIDYWRDVMVLGGWAEDTTRSPKARVTVTLNVNALPVMTVPPADELADGSAICDGLPAIVITAPGALDPIEVWGFDPALTRRRPATRFRMEDRKRRRRLSSKPNSWTSSRWESSISSPPGASRRSR